MDELMDKNLLYFIGRNLATLPYVYNNYMYNICIYMTTHMSYMEDSMLTYTLMT